MRKCFNPKCKNEYTENAIFCGECIPEIPIEKQVLDMVNSIESENEELFKKMEWCKEFNMNWQAEMYQQIYSHTRRIITRLRSVTEK